VQYEHITRQQQLVRYCEAASGVQWIAFDTEFVSEDSYHPELCLVQVATDRGLAVIDTLSVGDLAPFWEWLAAPGHQTIVHAGRYELCFCHRAIGKRPSRLFDTQIAAGLIGLEFPAAYRTLISKLLGEAVKKGETRTDWRRRPLSRRQVEYALQDVLYLKPIRDSLVEQLESLNRLSWLDAEMEGWQTKVETDELHDRWRRLSGLASLSPRSLAVVRELWHWRDAEARRKNCRPRRILRDDLMVELAKQQTDDIHRIRAIRGLNHRGKQRYLESISESIRRALDLPDDQCPRPSARATNRSQHAVLGQMLATALSSLCRAKGIAPSLVGTVDDMRELIAYTLSDDPNKQQQVPSLAQGWRAEVVGSAIADLLAGKLAICVTDPLSEHPLAFEPRSCRSHGNQGSDSGDGPPAE
jgi:ribonuclease D